MSAQKYLIVNADDLGQCSGINRGVFESFENGIVTSASLMVRWGAAAEAAEYVQTHSDLSVGLHVDLGEWEYRNGDWKPVYEVVDNSDSRAVAEEVALQLSLFRELVKREPTHIDSHQHVHRSEPIRSILIDAARRLNIPLRLCSEIHYCGQFYGQMNDGTPLWNNISVEALIDLLGKLPPGITELSCHPAQQVDLNTMYAEERLRELQVLRDKRIHDFIVSENIQLCSFHNVAGAQV
jgi:chitin disaccharide deacetylase